MEKLLNKEAKFQWNEDLPEGPGYFEIETSNHTNSDLSRVEQGVPCTCRCIIYSVGHSAVTTWRRGHRSSNLFCK
jgi:hypothetical protein